MTHLPKELPQQPDLKPTPTRRHSWKHVNLRNDRTNVCVRCGLVLSYFRNPETKHFDLRYHHPEGLSATAGKCK